MNRAKAENNIVSFSSFAERSARKADSCRLQVKARLALARGQKEAFLTELSGYVDEVLGDRALMIQEDQPGVASRARCRPAERFQLLQGGKQ